MFRGLGSVVRNYCILSLDKMSSGLNAFEISDIQEKKPAVVRKNKNRR
jgi:hypothetical protein